MNIKMDGTIKETVKLEIGDIIRIDFSALGSKFYMVSEDDGIFYLRSFDGTNTSFKKRGSDSCKILLREIINYGAPYEIFPASEYELKIVRK